MKPLFRVKNKQPQIDPFEQAEQNDKRFQKLTGRPAPVVRYAMHFTPRSGSSRVHNLCEKTGCLGRPGELFNKGLMTGIAKSYNATNLNDYIEVVSKVHATPGIFGFQITHGQMRALFQTGDRFLALTRPTHHFWLIREDIVAQAVSFSRKQQSKLAHSTQGDSTAHAIAEAEFYFDAVDIGKRLVGLAKMEDRTEAFFDQHGITPFRMSYEGVNAWGDLETVRQIANQIGLEDLTPQQIMGDHKKIGGPKSTEFAARFREEQPKLVAEIEQQRQKRLAALPHSITH